MRVAEHNVDQARAWDGDEGAQWTEHAGWYETVAAGYDAPLFDAAGLAGVRSHDLRRTFASVAADQGYSDATIGELLGHARRGVTARHYIRRPDAALVAAADRVSALVVAALDQNSLCGGPSR